MLPKPSSRSHGGGLSPPPIALARRLTLGLVVTGLTSMVLSTFLMYIFAYGKCDMISLLLPLLRDSARHLDSVEGTSGYWLDYGSLLGAVRDGGIIRWEFDLDMGVDEKDCDKYLALKEPMARDGLTMYKRGDWVPGKENVLLGYDGYLHKACARIYGPGHKVYIDFDWNRRLTYEQAMAEKKKEQAAGRKFDIPKGYKESDGDLLCNIEAWDARGDPGGCRLASWIFPLVPIDVLGVRQHGVAAPGKMLEAMYGADWRTPKPKGYKALLCGWMPVDGSAFLLAWIVLSSLPWICWLVLPDAWHALMVAAGRRSAHAGPAYTLITNHHGHPHAHASPSP